MIGGEYQPTAVFKGNVTRSACAGRRRIRYARKRLHATELQNSVDPKQHHDHGWNRAAFRSCRYRSTFPRPRHLRPQRDGRICDRRFAGRESIHARQFRFVDNRQRKRVGWGDILNVYDYASIVPSRAVSRISDALSKRIVADGRAVGQRDARLFDVRIGCPVVAFVLLGGMASIQRQSAKGHARGRIISRLITLRITMVFTRRFPRVA